MFLEQVCRPFQVWIHRLARQEQAHDFGCAFDDRIDACITHHALHGIGVFAPLLERGCFLIAPPASQLKGGIHDPPPVFRAEILGHRSLEPDVDIPHVCIARGEHRQGFHRKCGGSNEGYLLSTHFVMSDRKAPLDAFISVSPRDGEALLGHSRAAGRQCETANVQGLQRQPQTLSLGTNHVLSRNTDIRKFQIAVLHSAQSHEFAALRHLDPRHVTLNNERGHLLPLFASHNFGLGLCHHDKTIGDGGVGTPLLGSVKGVERSIG